MRLEMTEDVERTERRYVLTISAQEMASAKFQPFDYLLFKDIEEGPTRGTPIADALLGLETLAKRIEEAQTP